MATHSSTLAWETPGTEEPGRLQSTGSQTVRHDLVRLDSWQRLNLSQFSPVQSLSRVQLFATPWTAARQASLSIANSWSLLRLMSIELVMPSNHFF